jgi:plastocyanin
MRDGESEARSGRGRWYNVVVTAGAVVLVALIVVAVVLIVRGGGGSDIQHDARQPTVVTDALQVNVDVIDNDFRPANLTVKKGATVTWLFKGDLPHNVTEDSGAFASETLGKGATYERTFDSVGTFYYHCTIHHVMTGSVTVVE